MNERLNASTMEGMNEWARRANAQSTLGEIFKVTEPNNERVHLERGCHHAEFQRSSFKQHLRKRQHYGSRKEGNAPITPLEYTRMALKALCSWSCPYMLQPCKVWTWLDNNSRKKEVFKFPLSLSLILKAIETATEVIIMQCLPGLIDTVSENGPT